jgi:hypothetical protein
VNDHEPLCAVAEPSQWSDWMGIPPRSQRTWLTLAEMQAVLGAEGLNVTREVARAALVGTRTKKFRAWNCYEPKHVALVRRFARKRDFTRR